MIFRKSEIDKSYEITEYNLDENKKDKWVLTLARKTIGTHQQHAFFILEGFEDGKPAIWFMDLIGNPLLPNLTDSKIRIRHFVATSEEDLKSSPLLYRCSIKQKGVFAEMMDLHPNDTLVKKTWLIDKDYALRLIRSIEKDRIKPPVFNILGNQSVLTTASASSSSKDKGHNCFTYAKKKIDELNVPSIKIECDNTAYCIDYIASFTSLTLRHPNPKRSYCSSLWKPVVILGAAAAVTGILIDQARRYNYF